MPCNLGELKDGAWFIVVNEKPAQLRRKGGIYPGCAFKMVASGAVPSRDLHLVADSRNTFPDNPLIMVVEVQLGEMEG